MKAITEKRIIRWKFLRKYLGVHLAAALCGFYYAEYPLDEPRVWEVYKKGILWF